jgi:signal transduction histidine kinase
MKVWRWRFGGLSWRLILSYLLVTLVVAFTIAGALVVSQVIHNEQQSDTSPGNTLGKQGTIQLAPALEQATPDPEALRFLVATPLFDDLKSAHPHLTLVAILDHQGALLTAAACGRQQQLSSVSAAGCAADATRETDALLASAQAQEAIHRMLMGTQQPDEAAGTTTIGESFVVVPILGQEKQPIGVLVAVFVGLPDSPGSSSPGLGDLLAAIANDWTLTGFLLILLVSVVGTLTGALFSRNLTQRLHRIIQAAQAWSRGEFQVAVVDRSRDEVGQLAHDLNRMAGHLQTLLAARQELAVLEERNRLARELHDSVKQHVFANALLVRAARKMVSRNPDKAQSYLVDAEQLADQAQQELIALISALRPAAIADKGLVAALTDYTSDWERRMGVVVELRVQGARTTPLDTEETLFRVAQEALSNVARHSDAQQVEILLAWDEEQVRLTIQDNGKGFNAARITSKGFGLASMRERLEALHGTLMVSSSSNGTTVEASIPLAVPAAEPVEVIHE